MSGEEAMAPSLERPAEVTVEVPADVRERWDALGPEIVNYPQQVLRQVATAVGKPTPETRQLIERMKAAMKEFRGVGLAAPQLGVLQRVIVYQLPEDDAPLRVILNPKIIQAKGDQIGPEGCLSIPMLQGDVNRFNEVTVKGADALGRPFKRRATGYEARIIQHELDHLNGILFIDRADLATLEWIIPAEGEPDLVDEV